MTLLNLCKAADESFNELSAADYLTDYAVELRYPDDWYEPTVEEAMQSYELALRVKDFVLARL